MHEIKKHTDRRITTRLHRRAGRHVRACGNGLRCAIGLAETITEFVYSLLLLKSFTPFESIFFLTGGFFELAGELVAVTLGARYVWQANYCREDLVATMGVVLKDPIHNLAYPHRDAGVIVTAFLAASSLGVMVSNVPVLLWATLFPVGEASAVTSALGSC